MSEQSQREETAKWYGKYHHLRDGLKFNLPIMAAICLLVGYFVGVLLTKLSAY